MYFITLHGGVDVLRLDFSQHTPQLTKHGSSAQWPLPISIGRTNPAQTALEQRQNSKQRRIFFRREISV